jgi:hypothetical protein
LDEEQNMHDIHKIAADYLTKIKRSSYQEEQLEVQPIAEFTGLVALRRSEKPEFFHGFKPSGRPVFTHELRLAKSFHSMQNSLSEHISRLTMIGETVSLHPTVWFEGRHKSEQ